MSNEEIALIDEAENNEFYSEPTQNSDLPSDGTVDEKKLLFQGTTDLMLYLDKFGRILKINKAGLAFSGFSEEVVGKMFWKLPGVFSKRDAPKYLKVFKNTFKGIETKNFTGTLNDKSGKQHVMDFSTYPIMENKKLKYVFVAAKDITGQKETENRYRLITENTDELIAVTKFSLNPKYTYISPSHEKIMGYKPEELLGKPCLFFVHPDDKKKLISLLRKYVSVKGKKLFTGKDSNVNAIIEYRAKDKSGNWHYLETTANLMGNELLFVSKDITERKHAGEKIKQLHEYFQLQIDRMPIGLIVWNKEFRVASWNPSAERIFGFTAEEALGKHSYNIIVPGEAHQIVDEIWSRLLEGDKSAHSINENITKDGHTITCNWSNTPLKRADGTVMGVLSMVQDITERKKAEEKLRENEEKYSGFFKTSKDAMFITSKDGRLLENNDAFMKLLGYETRDELLKINISEHYENPEDRKKHIQMIEQQGHIKEFPFNLRKKDGSVINVLVTSVVIKDKNGNVTGLQGTIRDITEKKKSEEKIKQQNIKLKKLDHIKTDFLNVTSHELRTPMAAIKGYIQMLLKQTLGDVTPEQKDALNVVLKNTDRLDHLIQDILDISRLESGTMKFIPEKTDSTKAIKEIVETMQLSADVKNIKINTELEEIPELVIDQQRIKQALTNLVDNAIKFSLPDSTINLRIKMKKDDVLFEVQDFGRGIPKNKQKKIFEKFYQVDFGMDRKFGGAGLGLAISRGIVLAHGGRIWIDSTMGKGSTFKFSLPLESVKDYEDKFKEIDVFSFENNK